METSLKYVKHYTVLENENKPEFEINVDAKSNNANTKKKTKRIQCYLAKSGNSQVKKMPPTLGERDLNGAKVKESKIESCDWMSLKELREMWKKDGSQIATEYANMLEKFEKIIRDNTLYLSGGNFIASKITT